MKIQKIQTENMMFERGLEILESFKELKLENELDEIYGSKISKQ